MKKSSFEDLECWKVSRQLRIYIKKQICPRLPPEEKYVLRDQMVRASRSVTANIAEGYGRYHYLDEAKFLSNSRGTLHELLDHAITAYDDEYIPQEILSELRNRIDEAIRLVNGYRAYVIRRSKE